MKFQYIDHKFNNSSLALIGLCQDIIEDYQGRGYSLTLRQLYYQLVSRDLIPNNKKSYDRLGSIITKARMAGLIDWDAIVDRTRNIRTVNSWSSPQSILRGAKSQYKVDLWEDQESYLEVWVEKEALAGVMQRATNIHRVPFIACKGYMSISAIYNSSQRFLGKIEDGKKVTVLHLGDHDPSGIDMTRDNYDRIELMLRSHLEDSWLDFEVKRLALNMEQIERYSPPPNFAKLSDTRASTYVSKFGYDSWELDALDPDVLVDLVQSEIGKYISWDDWDNSYLKEDEGKSEIQKAIDYLNNGG